MAAMPSTPACSLALSATRRCTRWRPVPVAGTACTCTALRPHSRQVITTAPTTGWTSYSAPPRHRALTIQERKGWNVANRAGGNRRRLLGTEPRPDSTGHSGLSAGGAGGSGDRQGHDHSPPPHHPATPPPPHTNSPPP